MSAPKSALAQSKLKPNSALRQVRKAVGMSQRRFADVLGVSTAYIQAIELGHRAASTEFAEIARDRLNVWPRCLVQNWPIAVDVDGKAYSNETSNQLAIQTSPEQIMETLQTFFSPIPILLEGARRAGKTSVALSLIRDKLYEAANRLLCLDGVTEAMERELAANTSMASMLHELKKHHAAQIEYNAEDGSRTVHLSLSPPRPQKPSWVEDLCGSLQPTIDPRALEQRSDHNTLDPKHTNRSVKRRGLLKDRKQKKR